MYSDLELSFEAMKNFPETDVARPIVEFLSSL
jgi:hypothetical protein